MKKLTQILTVTTAAFFVLISSANADPGDYVYKQTWMPKETVKIDLSKTAFFVTDPQNDFLSEKSPAWGLVGPTVIKHKVVEKEITLKALAKQLKIPVFYSTHMYTPQDFANWKSLNGIDKVMFDNKMFAEGTWGHEIHPELKPDSNTVVMNPHKGLSNFWTGEPLSS